MFKKLTAEYGGADFQIIIDNFGESTLERFTDKIYASFCKEYTNADYLKNIEWQLRHYYASKKIILSTLFYTQSKELNGKGLKNLIFYTCYYSLYNALLSNLIITPYLCTNKIKKISHSQIFSHIENYFIRFGIYDTKLIDLLNDLRLTRELFSYHLPLGGTFVKEGEPLNDEILFSRLSEKIKPILQISNLISLISYYAWEKKVGESVDEYEKYRERADNLFFSFIEHHDYLKKNLVIDGDDYYRQGYILKNLKKPFPISWFINEKICEDLECGWNNSDDNSGFDITLVARFLSDSIGAI